MAKIKTHVRVAKGRSGKMQVTATNRASNEPLEDSRGNALPTVAFALVLDINDLEFKRAEAVLAEVDVPSGEVRILKPSVQSG
jgi:hypothetical protein